jgi:hypothetical protein
MFADDTSIMMKSNNISQLQSELNIVMSRINEWFQENLIALNLNKTYFIHFSNKDTNNSDIQIKIENANIAKINEIKFLGLMIDNKLSWKGHIDYIILRLNSACYCMRAVKTYVLHNTLKIIYYSYFHSVMTYGFIFWGSSTESIKIFRLQKRMIRIMVRYKRNQSCRELFHKLGTLSLPSQYIHNYATRQYTNFHLPSVSLTKYQKGIGYLGVNVINKLPQYLKEEFDNLNKFEQSLKNYLNIKTFYSLQEYFES